LIGGLCEMALERARAIGASAETLTDSGRSMLSTDFCGAIAMPVALPSKSMLTATSSISTSHGSGFSPNCDFMYAARFVVVVRSRASIAN
jgi:hypothetical protein